MAVWANAPAAPAYPNNNGFSGAGYCQTDSLIYSVGGGASGQGGGMHAVAVSYDGTGYTTLASLPKITQANACCIADGDLWSFGGWGGNYNEVYRLQSGVWVAKAVMPGPRADLGKCASVVGRKVYICGGANNQDVSVHSTCYEYDLDTNTWATKAAMPGPRRAHLQLEHDGKVYIFGGRSTWSGGETNSVFVYDPVTNAWDTSSAPMPLPRNSHSGFVGPDGRFFIFGGLNAGETCWVYNPRTDTWSDFEPSLVETRYGVVAGYLGNNVYLLGGQGSSGFTLTSGLVTQAVWQSGPGSLVAYGVGEYEVEIEIPWFRPNELHIPRRGDFSADDDAHRANERARQNWHDDPIEDFGTIIEKPRE